MNILENNVIQERMDQYRAEEFAASIGILTQYGEDRQATLEKNLAGRYKIDFEDSGGVENLTMTVNSTPPRVVSVRVPTTLDLPDKTFRNSTICINKTRDTGSSPEEVKINEGSC